MEDIKKKKATLENEFESLKVLTEEHEGDKKKLEIIIKDQDEENQNLEAYIKESLKTIEEVSIEI